MKSSSTIFVERDAAVVVDMTSMRTSGLRNRQRLAFGNSFANPVKTEFELFWPSHFCLPTHVWYFPGFSWLVSRFTWVIAEWETQVCLSCKITPDASAVSESGEEGEESKIRRPTLQLILKNTTEPIYMKMDSNIANTLDFHLGV